jgi:hypothetical protein
MPYMRQRMTVMDAMAGGYKPFERLADGRVWWIDQELGVVEVPPPVQCPVAEGSCSDCLDDGADCHRWLAQFKHRVETEGYCGRCLQWATECACCERCGWLVYEGCRCGKVLPDETDMPF